MINVYVPTRYQYTTETGHGRGGNEVPISSCKLCKAQVTQTHLMRPEVLKPDMGIRLLICNTVKPLT